MELVFFLLLVGYAFAAIPLSLIIGGKIGVYFALFSALVEFVFEAATFASGNTIDNTLLCNGCGTTSAYPYILLPDVITIFQFGITFTKRY